MSDCITYNLKKYHYADSTQVRIYSRPLHKGTHNINIDSMNEYDVVLTDFEKNKKNIISKKSSQNRTIQSIYSIARANIWEFFLTLTFDRNLVDSSDYDLVTKKSCNFIKNLKNRCCPDLKYILVPELHADRQHWHIHGLLSNASGLNLFKTDIVKNGKVIYNLSNWNYGFSTVTHVEHTGKVSSYIVKYITKELCDFSQGKKRYWASKNCLRANDVLTIDLLTADEVSLFYQQNADNIVHIKTQSCVQSGQRVQYVELEE